jgi:predicted phage-related endonuclease
MPKLTRDDQLSCSQLPALMGYSKYATPNDVLEFCCKAINGDDPRTPAGEAADWGNLLEPTIIAEMAARLKLDRFTFPQEAFVHTTLPLGASADAIGYPSKEEPHIIKHDPANGIYVVDGDEIELDGPGVLESKLTRGFPEEELPLYRGPIQVQGVMMCTGHRWAAIGTLYNGIEMRIFLFKPHIPTMTKIAEIAKDFDYRLDEFRETRTPLWFPPSDTKDANRVWSQATEDSVDLDELGELLADRIVKAKMQIAELEDEISQSEVKLKELMRDHASAVAGKYNIRWPMRHYKEQPEKVVAAKPAYSIRQSTLTIKEAK